MDTSVCDSESIGSDEDTVLNAGYEKKINSNYILMIQATVYKNSMYK